MVREKKKSLMKRFFSSPLFVVSALIVAVFFLFSYGRAYVQDYQIKKEIADLEKEVAGLEKKKLESLEVLEYVTSDDFLEERARKELNMKKPGEQVIIITNELEGHEIKNTQKDADSSMSNPKKWWYYFSHKSI